MKKKIILKTGALSFLPIILAGGVCFSQSAEQLSGELKFRKQVLTTDFISEGVAVGDVNKDGKPDIIAGAFWFEAPAWKRHELAEPRTFSTVEYSNSCLNFSMDVNRDGWIDLVRFVFPGSAVVWHENPRNKGGRWKIDTIHYSAGNESPGMYDVDEDGRPDLLCSDLRTREIIWLQAPLRKRRAEWKKFAVSDTMAPGSDIFSHGLGLGDINGDGRPDILVKEGWWEAPGDPEKPGWEFHPANFGEDCSQMYALDVDSDGDQDVISASAHRYGIWWHEQMQDAEGGLSWKTHEISKVFSQTHALNLADMNGDGHPDLVTGKRYFAHNGHDPGGLDPAVLYWFEFTPEKKPYWKAHEIDNDSGAGLNIVTRDMNGDGLPDIVVGNKKGVFFFEREKP